MRNNAVEKDKQWTNLMDQHKKLYNELNIQSIPTNYLVDEKGVLLGIRHSPGQVEALVIIENGFRPENL